MNENNQLGKEVHKEFYTSRDVIWKGDKWARPCFPFIFEKNQFNSICDIGCGDGTFINTCYENGIETCYASDLTTIELGFVKNNNNITYIDSAASELDLPENSVEVVTSFEVLEHIHPREVDATLQNMFRIASKYLCFSIAHVLSGEKTQTHNLHLTVQSWEWWKNKLEKYGTLVEKLHISDSSRSYCIWSKTI